MSNLLHIQMGVRCVMTIYEEQIVIEPLEHFFCIELFYATVVVCQPFHWVFDSDICLVLGCFHEHRMYNYILQVFLD